MFGHAMDQRLHSPSDRWILPKQLIGVEFEAERVIEIDPDHELHAYYTVKADHSLRDGGLEFVFSNPLMGEDLSRALDLMEKHSKDFVCNERTGLHIHLDVREQEQVNTYRLFQLYALYEYFIYKFAGDGRSNSNYCVPWYKSTEQYGFLAHVLNTKDQPLTGTFAEQNISRYMGLNIQSMERFGSLEFRHLQNTHDFQRISDWINLIMELKKASETEEIVGDDFLDKISLEGAMRFTSKHLPLLFSKFGDDSDFLALFEKGLDTCREMSFSALSKKYFYSGINPILNKYKGKAEGVDKFLAKQIKTEPL